MKRKLLSLVMVVAMAVQVIASSNVMALTVNAKELQDEETISEETLEDSIEVEASEHEKNVIEAEKLQETTGESDISDDDSDLDSEYQVTGELDEETEFHYEENISGYIVTLDAEEGILPAATSVSIKKIDKVNGEAVEEIIDSELSVDDVIVETVTFDITFTDAEGSKIEPEDGAVKVSIKVADSLVETVEDAVEEANSADDVEIKVFHITDDANVEEVSSVEADVENIDDVVFMAEEFSSYTLVVLTHYYDVKAPVLRSLTLTKDTYDKSIVNDEMPNLIAEATDDVSGVAYVGIDFYCEENRCELNFRLDRTMGDEYTCYDPYYYTAEPGVYKIKEICVPDKAGNELIYSAEKGNIPKAYKTLTITVKSDGAAVFEPIISEFEIENTTFTIPATINTTTVIDPNSSDVSLNMVTVIFKQSNGKELDFYYGPDPDGRVNAFWGVQTFEDDEYIGKYTVDFVKIDGTDKNRWEPVSAIYSAEKGNLPEILRDKTITLKSPAAGTAPTISDIQFERAKIDITKLRDFQQIDMVVTAKAGSDKISSISVNMVDEATKNNLEFASGGLEFYSSQYKIYGFVSAYQPSGNYKISSIKIKDVKGHTRYYTADGTTAPNPNYIKSKFNTAMKNISLTINNSAHPAYNIAFNANGGTGTMASMTGCNVGAAYTLTANSFTKKGYKFSGWNTRADGTGKAYANKASVKDLTTKDGTTVKLYAQWKKAAYTITYNLNGGTNSSKNPATYTITTATISLASPKKTGYTFKGWYSDSAYKTKVTEITKGTTGNKTLYARWIANTYTVKFSGNGASSGKMSNIACTYGKSYTLATNAYKKKGYTFKGWNTKADGSGKAYDNKATVKNLTSKNGATVTLYAQWKKATYKIIYNLNGGTNNTANPEKYTISTATIKLANPKRSGYTFKGWYSDSTFKTRATEIAKGSTGNKTLYAKWQKK